MKVQFQDIYGQHVTIHDETNSGNIRLEVCTCQNINDVHSTPKGQCPVITDISLDEGLAMILYGALTKMMESAER
jgi:hypothetical protein